MSWRERAACRDKPVQWFFPEREYEFSQGQQAARTRNSNQVAKMICSTCPVRSECLDEAIENGERWGIWGGTTPGERAGMRPRSRTQHGTYQGYLRLRCRNGCPASPSCREAHTAYIRGWRHKKFGPPQENKHGHPEMWDRCDCAGCKNGRKGLVLDRRAG